MGFAFQRGFIFFIFSPLVLFLWGSYTFLPYTFPSKKRKINYLMEHITLNIWSCSDTYFEKKFKNFFSSFWGIVPFQYTLYQEGREDTRQVFLVIKLNGRGGPYHKITRSIILLIDDEYANTLSLAHLNFLDLGTLIQLLYFPNSFSHELNTPSFYMLMLDF